MVTEDGLSLILTRLENATIRASENYKLLDQERKKRIRVEDDNRRSDLRVEALERDLRNADNKIAEWLMFSEDLIRLIPLKARKKIGKLPKPLETDIPF